MKALTPAPDMLDNYELVEKLQIKFDCSSYSHG